MKTRKPKLVRVTCLHHRRPQVHTVLAKFLPLRCSCGHYVTVVTK